MDKDSFLVAIVDEMLLSELKSSSDTIEFCMRFWIVLPKPTCKYWEKVFRLLRVARESIGKRFHQSSHKECLLSRRDSNNEEIKEVGIILNGLEDCEMVGLLSGNLGSH